jgi:hypothetical protein
VVKWGVDGEEAFNDMVSSLPGWVPEILWKAADNAGMGLSNVLGFTNLEMPIFGYFHAAMHESSCFLITHFNRPAPAPTCWGRGRPVKPLQLPLFSCIESKFLSNEILGLDRSTLRARMRKLDIRKP